MSVRSASRTLDLLELLAQQNQALPLSELARMVGLPKSSALLLLRTLEARRYIVHERGGYRLVRLPGEAAAGSPAWGTLVRIAMPLLHAAVEAMGESGFIAVLTEAGQVRYLCKILPAARELKYDRDIAADRTLHHVSSGMALLAVMPDSAVAAYVAALRSDDPVVVKAGVMAARSEGVAVNLKGRIEGAAGVAAVIPGVLGAAVNLAGPAERIRDRLPALKIAVRDLATGIGEALARRTPVSRPPADAAA